jgi:signal transduction histidine kinase/ActR/RegA family two-component response regulator
VLGVPLGALGEVSSELLYPEDEPKLVASMATLEAGGRASIDYRVRTGTGGERWIRDAFQHLPGSGDAGVFVGVLRDVSVEHTLRAQITALEERIWRAQRVDSLGGLATGIAHDLGNLLTAILSAIQLVEESPETPQSVLDDLEVARESARRGSDFVRQILRFAAREEYVPGPVDLNVVVDDLRVILGRSLGTDVRLVVEKATELPAVTCDPGQMEQVLLNLAVNAREAMPIGGQLSISTRVERIASRLPMNGATLSPGEYVVLSVSDTGRGIPAEVQRRIFEPFFSTKTRKESGSGFGLSTVQRIVHSHAGAVRVHSVPGEGTTFDIYLPVRPPARSLPEVAPGAAAVRETPGVARVLVAETDPVVRDVMKRALAREHYSVMAVGSANDALRLFDRVRPPFDVVVTDLVLPDRSGEDLVRQLRRRVARLAVVYVVGTPGTAGGEEPEAVYLDKPFTPADLLNAVQRALAVTSPRARQAGSSAAT